MNPITHPDIQTASNILLTEAVLITAFFGLTFLIDGLLFMLWGLVAVSIVANIIWAIRLLLKKPRQYALYAALLQLPLLIIVVLFFIILNALSGVTC